MVGGIAVLASIMRIYALYIFAVSDDIEYDDIFVSCYLACVLSQSSPVS